MAISTAFLVCAGLGTRMKPLTDTCPKPLLPLNGRPLLDYILDHLRATSVRNVIVNSHHLPAAMDAYLATVTDFTLLPSYEPVLLETGGGLVKALATYADIVGDSPLLMINGDAFWTDDPARPPTLNALESAFDPEKMDILLCLIPVARMTLTEGVGDYDLLPDGQIRRNPDKRGTHMFTGIRILNPAIMAGYTEEKFSFLKNMDVAQEKNKLYGYVMEGNWHHISTPLDLHNVEKHLVDT